MSYSMFYSFNFLTCIRGISEKIAMFWVSKKLNLFLMVSVDLNGNVAVKDLNTLVFWNNTVIVKLL